MTTISRRTALQVVAGAGALGLAAPPTPAAPAVQRGFDLADPMTAHRTHVKMVGSLGVKSFIRSCA